MHLAFALAMLFQSEPSPIDAFRANLASTEVSIKFTFDYYHDCNKDFLKQLRDGNADIAEPASSPAFVIEGLWEYDGEAERYLQRTVGGTSYDPKSSRGIISPAELIRDHEVVAYRYLRHPESTIRVDYRADVSPFSLIGPWTWRSDHRLDRELLIKEKDADKRTESREILGKPADCEIYTRQAGAFRIQSEIAYDPGLGYLPRFYRSIARRIEGGTGSAGVYEMYLVEAQPGFPGGFVPCEYYVVGYHIEKNFEARYPNYVPFMALQGDGLVSLGHFRATSIEPKTGPVALEELKGVTGISSQNKFVDNTAGYSRLSIQDIKDAVGATPLSTNQHSLPNIDVAERDRFQSKPSGGRVRLYVVIGIVLLIGSIVIVRRRSL